MADLRILQAIFDDIHIIGRVSSLREKFNSENLGIVVDMKKWISIIRSVQPQMAFYVIVQKYTIPRQEVTMDEPLYDSRANSYLLTSNDINWPNYYQFCHFDKKFRAQYFVLAGYNTNIWILKEEFQRDCKVINSLIKPHSIPNFDTNSS